MREATGLVPYGQCPEQVTFTGQGRALVRRFPMGARLYFCPMSGVTTPG